MELLAFISLGLEYVVLASSVDLITACTCYMDLLLAAIGPL